MDVIYSPFALLSVLEQNTHVTSTSEMAVNLSVYPEGYGSMRLKTNRD